MSSLLINYDDEESKPILKPNEINNHKPNILDGYAPGNLYQLERIKRILKIIISIFILLAIISIFFYFAKVDQIKQIAIIDGSHIVVREDDSFNQDYSKLKYLNVSNGIAIIQTNFTPSYSNGSKLEVILLETIYCPSSEMETVMLKSGFGIEVVKVNSTTYRTTIYFSSTEIYFDCYLPIEYTEIYTSGWLKVISVYGEHYMSAIPTFIRFQPDTLLEKMKMVSYLVKLNINNIRYIFF
ncbi:hypothetical protein PPL_00963 [Heterostelium album PN500]|uniref:Uncharacterized protein n=1 Tax=Heterostelium pallidum (strain ATCC 26659 / Pp 5 / PN500) TaxID=670386 RepID=D3AXQ6_HETP5|nr:hypothetical protein PPL_00963 [Heterostelium album PN500]EFA85733.1 hypothetical protein PPL_00963 [Heterostelium album PN500]|eukprot:XP_020437839.1 hypothetical protein PPL_00963 [Heterostelium album PN500]